MRHSDQQIIEYLRDHIGWAFSSEGRTGSLYEQTSSTGSFGAKCPLPPWAFKQTPTVQAVKKLPLAQQTLVKFVAGVSLTQDDIGALLVDIYYRFYRLQLQQRRLNATSIPKAQRLVEYALINYKNLVARQPQCSKQEIMRAISINDPKSYRTDWQPRMTIMQAVIAEQETQALQLVLLAIDEHKRNKKRA